MPPIFAWRWPIIMEGKYRCHGDAAALYQSLRALLKEVPNPSW